MPVGESSLGSTEFRYITVDQLRQEGITEDALSNDRALSLISLAGQLINVLTKQWFLPVRARQKCDGRQSAVVHHPLMVPIQELFSLRLHKQNLVDVEMPDVAYQVKPRYVMMMSWNANLPSTPYFVQLDGVFGWLEDDFYKTTTYTTADVAPGDTEIPVNSIAGINFGDALLVGNEPELGSGAVLCKGFDGNSILCDPIRFTCAANSRVVRYGRVPLMIQRAAMLIVKDRMTPIGEEGNCNDTNSPMWYLRRLQSESVEGYSYSLMQLPAPYGFGGGAWTSGNPEVDDICQMYCCPCLYVGNTG